MCGTHKTARQVVEWLHGRLAALPETNSFEVYGSARSQGHSDDVSGLLPGRNQSRDAYLASSSFDDIYARGTCNDRDARTLAPPQDRQSYLRYLVGLLTDASDPKSGFNASPGGPACG